MRVIPLSLDWFISRLERNVSFSFVRYGDGEFECLTGKVGENCDHTKYTSDLANALAQTLVHPHDDEYHYAIGPKAFRVLKTSRWLEQRARVEKWYDSETFLHASLRGELYPLVETLARRKVILVGGQYLERLPGIKPLAHVVVSDVNAWAERERSEIELVRYAAPDVVILFSAGMLSKVLMWRLHHQMPEVTMIDTGSLFDVYCGKDSRRYARKMDAKQKRDLLLANFGSPQIIKVEMEHAHA